MAGVEGFAEVFVKEVSITGKSLVHIAVVCFFFS